MTYDEWTATLAASRHVLHGRDIHWTDTHVTVSVGERLDGQWVEIDGEPAGMELELLRTDLSADPIRLMAVCVVLLDDTIVDARDAREGCTCSS